MHYKFSFPQAVAEARLHDRKILKISNEISLSERDRLVRTLANKRTHREFLSAVSWVSFAFHRLTPSHRWRQPRKKS